MVLRACGRLTLGHGGEDALCKSLLDAAGGPEIALDLSCVTQFDARGLGVLADLAAGALQQRIGLSVVGASRVTQRLARLTRLQDVIPGNWNDLSDTPACRASSC